jgi:hypothetical protein
MREELPPRVRSALEIQFDDMSDGVRAQFVDLVEKLCKVTAEDYFQGRSCAQDRASPSTPQGAAVSMSPSPGVEEAYSTEGIHSFDILDFPELYSVDNSGTLPLGPLSNFSAQCNAGQYQGYAQNWQQPFHHDATFGADGNISFVPECGDQGYASADSPSRSPKG